MMDLAGSSSSKYICRVWCSLSLPFSPVHSLFLPVCCISVNLSFTYAVFMFLHHSLLLYCVFLLLFFCRFTMLFRLSLSLTFSLHISCSLELVKYRQDPHGWLSLSIGHLCILRYYLASLNQR